MEAIVPCMAHFRSYFRECVKVQNVCLWKWKSLGRVLFFATPWTVHGILQARILEWVAFPFSRGFSQLRDQTQVFHIAGGFFTSWVPREALLITYAYNCHSNQYADWFHPIKTPSGCPWWPPSSSPIPSLTSWQTLSFLQLLNFVISRLLYK